MFLCACGKEKKLERSISCHSCANRREWKNGKSSGRTRKFKIVDKRGYTWLWVSEEKKYRQEHVLIAEKALGRGLRYGELVHHINGVRSDNRNLNFVICTQKYHAELHHRMSQLYMQEHFNAI